MPKTAPMAATFLQLELTSATPRALPAGTVPQALATPDALLLAWLAVQGPTPRERLAQLLWPRSEPGAARNALRQRLFRLKRQCGVDPVAGTAVLALAQGVTHDLTGSLPLLGNLRAADCPELEEWLDTQRQQRLAHARRATEQQIDLLEQQGDPNQALPLALSLVEADPTSEDAHRRLMRLHYLRGDRAAAMQAFDRCEQWLKHEVGTTPSASTLELLRLIERSAPLADAPKPRNAVPASLLRPPRMVGRDAELAALQRALAGAGARSVVLLVGEAGMGKSRLMQALSAQRSGIVHAAGRPGDHVVPFATLARALRALIARAGPDVHEDLRHHLAPLLRELAADDHAAAAKRPLVQPVLALLRAVHASCDIWALDDLHFADDASLELLGELADSPAEDLAATPHWLLGVRPPAAGSRLHSLIGLLGQAGPITRLVLRPLDVAQLGELVESMALPGVTGADWGETLHRRSGGNPLFALETLKLAWNEGALAAGGPAVPALPKPQSLAQLIEQQLARLSPGALALARVAAVAGVDFSIPLAEALLNRSAVQLADAWAELEAQQILRAYDFAHDLIHDAVLQGLPQVISRHLHAQTATWLEAENGEPARVVAYWEAAGQPGRAMPALRRAAELAHRALREEENIGFLMRATEIAEGDGRADEAFVLLRQVVAAQMNTIRQSRGLPLLDRLDRLAHTPEQKVIAAGDRAWYATVMGDLPTSIAVGERVLALLPAIDDEAIAAPIRQRLGSALGMAGRFSDALPLMRSVEAWIDARGTEELQQEFHGNLAALLDNLGRPAEARRHHERGLEGSLRRGDHAGRVTHLANYAQSRLDAGDAASAAELLGQAQQVLDAFEMRGASAGFVAVLRAQCDRLLGNFTGALAWCDRAEDLLAEANVLRLPVVAMHRAHIWLDLGQHARALQLLDGAALDAGRALAARHGVRWRVLLARTRRRLGQDSQPMLEEALASIPAAGWPDLTFGVQIEMALGMVRSQALDLLTQVAGGAHALLLHGTALSAHLHAAWLGSSTDSVRALQHAEAACNMDSGIVPLHGDPALRWLGPAAAFAAAGDRARAEELIAEGRRWLRQAVDNGMAPEFRAAFLQQHPTNRALDHWVAGSG